MITPEQRRAVRALLNRTQCGLVKRAKLSTMTIDEFERNKSRLKDSTAQLLRMAFEAEGVIPIGANGGGPGVRPAKPDEATWRAAPARVSPFALVSPV